MKNFIKFIKFNFDKYFKIRNSINQFVLQSNKHNQRFKKIITNLKNLQLYEKSVSYDRHYVYHVAWAVRKIIEKKPNVHNDFSSSLHFCTTLSAVLPVFFFDFRPVEIQLDNLKCMQGDLTNLEISSNSLTSVSCMHVIEHIGLGRYGDALDYDGDIKALKELTRVLAVDGTLLLVVPIGNEAKIIFNAHRIYSYNLLKEMFDSLNLSVIEFSLIPENETDGGIVINPSPELLSRQHYACACFELTKKE